MTETPAEDATPAWHRSWKVATGLAVIPVASLALPGLGGFLDAFDLFVAAGAIGLVSGALALAIGLRARKRTQRRWQWVTPTVLGLTGVALAAWIAWGIRRLSALSNL